MKEYKRLIIDSVVLSREEYEKLLNKECLRGWIWKEGFNDGKKLYSEAIACMRDTIENQKVELENKEKETAEKVLNEVASIIKTQSVNDYNFDDKVIEEPLLLNKLKEIATREGVEIKE